MTDKTVQSPSGSAVPSPSVDSPESPHGASVGSPCVGICELDSDFVCKGCGRTIEEVLKWPEYTDEQKQQVINRIFGEANNGTDCHT
jgi:hypothetical protein